MSAFLTADNIASVAANLVGTDLGLAKYVRRDLDSEYTSGGSNTVRVRVPGSTKAAVKGIYDLTTPLTVGSINEQLIPVTLTDHVHSSVPLSEGAMSLDIKDFATQVLVPQAASIVKHTEAALAATMSAVPATALTYDAANPARVFTLIRKQLRDNGVSADVPIYAAVGSSVYAALLDGPVGTFDADGKVRGIEVIESNRIADDNIIAFIKDAFVVVVRAPEVPGGAAEGASYRAPNGSEDAFALRWLRSYDGSTAVDRSIVGAFIEVAPLPLAVDDEATGTVDLVENGGVVRVDTAA